MLTKPCLSWDYKLPFSSTPLIRPPGLYSITSPPEFYRVNCSEVILKLSIIFSHTRGGRGRGVSKEICGTVRLPVWRNVSRQRLSNWRAKYSSKRRIKLSILSRKYCSDFLNLEILRFLLSKKTRLKYFFEMKCPVV